MANTQLPPTGFVPANFTEPGPFSNYLAIPAQQQTQALQNQGQQWSGREGAVGVGAGLLTNWINGMSAGKARALAQRHEQEQQNAQRLNQYKQAVAESDLHDDDKKALIAQATQLEHRVINDHIVEAGKSNPFMKALGVVQQTLMGGPPVDQIYDPVQKKMIKREIGVIHPQEMQGLYDKLYATPSSGSKRTAESQDMFSATTDAYNQLLMKHPNEPITATMMMTEYPDLWKKGQAFEERFPGHASPITQFMSGLQPPMDPIKRLEYGAISGALGSPTTAVVPGSNSGEPVLRSPVGIDNMPNGGMASNYLGTSQMPVIAPPPSQYQHTATNSDGHQIGSNDGQTWVDIKTGQKVQ